MGRPQIYPNKSVVKPIVDVEGAIEEIIEIIEEYPRTLSEESSKEYYEEPPSTFYESSYNSSEY